MMASLFGGKTGLLSQLQAGLCQSTDFQSVQELEKPLYYILEEVGAEEMSKKSIKSKKKVAKFQGKGSQQRFRNLLHRLSWLLTYPSNKRFGSESISLHVDTSVSADGTETNEKLKTGPSESVSHPMIASHQFPGKNSYGSDLLSRVVCDKHPSGIPPLYPSKVQTIDELVSFSQRSLSEGYSSQFETERRDLTVSERSSSQTGCLGVSYPHPAYIEKCLLFLARKSATRDQHYRTLWEGLETGLTDGDDFTLPPTRTEVEIARADSWGSEGEIATLDSWGCKESSISPGDKQSNQEDLLSGSVTFRDEFPFDELATDNVPKASVAAKDVTSVALSHDSKFGSLHLAYIDDDAESIDSYSWIRLQHSSTPNQHYHQPFCSMLDSSSIVFRGPTSLTR